MDNNSNTTVKVITLSVGGYTSEVPLDDEELALFADIRINILQKLGISESDPNIDFLSAIAVKKWFWEYRTPFRHTVKSAALTYAAGTAVLFAGTGSKDGLLRIIWKLFRES